LIWKVKIIVLGEIDHLSIPLRNENIDLFIKCSLVPNPVQIEQDNIVLGEIPLEEFPIFRWAAIEENPSFNS
jgi:hypothetical protein